jgi:tRNA nucleotidyltransferase (CCA-adding enzyme)
MVPMNIINIYENYNLYFNADLKNTFSQLSSIAKKSGHKIYLIGGIVRDMLLNQKSLDIDITVEGDAIEFAHILKNKIGAEILSTHQNFDTATIEFNNQKIDLASTRSEIYPKKGHLPQVDAIGCSLEKDVLRRDFTINSLAMSLNQENFADLIDYTGGFEDLKAKKIKVLYDKSFIDDPTRIIRGLKYASRLGFELEEYTQKLQEEYLKNINYDMGIKRIKQEIKKTFEYCTDDTFDKFVDQKIYKLLTKSCQNNTPERFRNEFGMMPGAIVENLITKYKPKHPWIVYFGITVIDENLDKFELTKSEKEIIEGAKCLINKKFNDDFEIYKAFCAQKTESLLILAALGMKKEVLHYLDNLAKIKLSITGHDLIKLGIKPSKEFSTCFDCVLKEKLKNPMITKSKELELIKGLMFT